MDGTESAENGSSTPQDHNSCSSKRKPPTVAGVEKSCEENPCVRHTNNQGERERERNIHFLHFFMAVHAVESGEGLVLQSQYIVHDC